MKKDKFILAIESSCDDTSVALMRGTKLIDCIILSSSKLHVEYGGIVPELAAREHEKHIIPIVKEIFFRNGIEYREVTHIAYTKTPGLIGSLLVGEVLAKTLAFIWDIPLVPINHVYGHIFSVGLTEKIVFPFLSLVVSGKTTALYHVKGFKDVELLDSTTDNALGEVYDKVARALGYEYPGGPKIDELFDRNLKVDKLLEHNLNPANKFSYSGILSATLRRIRLADSAKIPNRDVYISTVFQRFVIGELINKFRYWMLKKNLRSISISGGVSANRYLREEIAKLGVEFTMADVKYSNDNAAMIAYYASCIIV